MLWVINDFCKKMVKSGQDGLIPSDLQECSWHKRAPTSQSQVGQALFFSPVGQKLIAVIFLPLTQAPDESTLPLMTRIHKLLQSPLLLTHSPSSTFYLVLFYSVCSVNQPELNNVELWVPEVKRKARLPGSQLYFWNGTLLTGKYYSYSSTHLARCYQDKLKKFSGNQ